MQRTVMIDGREVLIDDQITGEEITELAGPNANQFPVIVRNNGAVPMRHTVQDSQQSYQLMDDDQIVNMYRVPNGG